MVVDDQRMILCDFVPINDMSLDGNGEVSTQKTSVHFPQFKQESARGILLDRKEYQRSKQGREQFEAVMLLTRKKITDNSSNGQIF